MSRGRRLSIILAGLIAVYLIGSRLGLDASTLSQALRAEVAQAGIWAWPLYCAGFVLGVVLQVPGMVFVALAPLLFQPLEAWCLCVLAGNLAVNANFVIVRRLGGQVLTELPWPWARRLLNNLESHPVRSVVILRTIFLMLPPVTGALALTRISGKAHAWGTFLGLLLPLTVMLGAGFWLLD